MRLAVYVNSSCLYYCPDCRRKVPPLDQLRQGRIRTYSFSRPSLFLSGGLMLVWGHKTSFCGDFGAKVAPVWLQMTLDTRSNGADYLKVRPQVQLTWPICNDGDASTFNAHELTLIPQTVALLVTMLSLLFIHSQRLQWKGHWCAHVTLHFSKCCHDPALYLLILSLKRVINKSLNSVLITALIFHLHGNNNVICF